MDQSTPQSYPVIITTSTAGGTDQASRLGPAVEDRRPFDSVFRPTFLLFPGDLRPQKPLGLLGTGEDGGSGRLYNYRYTVTTGMTPALRSAAVRAILTFN